MSKVLAVDLGSRRIGLALSGEMGWGARPLYALARGATGADMDKIAEIARSYGVELVVVGLPLRLGGEEGPEARRARQFAQGLARRVGMPVVTWDERLSTAEAEQALIGADVSRQKRKELVDALAAAAILASYLEAHRQEGGGPSPGG